MNATWKRWLMACAAVVLVMATALPAYADWATGVAAYRNKDYATAVTEFEGVTKTNPDYAGAYYMLGMSQQALGKLSQALASLRKAVELDSANTSYKLALGQALVQAKQYQDAYRTLSTIQAQSLDAAHRSTHAILFAQAATKTNRPGEAVNVLSAQTRADSRNARLFRALGVAQDALGDEAKAFAAFKTAFGLDSRDHSSARSAISSAISVARRSRSAQEKGRYYSEAGNLAERLAGTSATFEHFLLAGEAWLGAKQYSKALSWFEKAQAKQPKNALVRFYSGQAYSSLERFPNALAQLQEALKIGATGKLRKQIYTQLGYVYDKTGDYDRAASAYSEVGAQSKVTEMREKKAQAEQNQAAEQEQADFRRRLQALELQIAELEKLGEMDQANQLREQLNELKSALR